MNQRQDVPDGRWALPIPATRPPVVIRPADVLRELATLLRSYGLDRLYWSACTVCGVLSLPCATVWLCDGRFLTWRHDTAAIRWPAADTEGAARQLATLAGRKIP
jgi:hypothetical protein